MKAQTITRHGGIDVLQMADVPTPGLLPHDLLIQVHASSINPVDCKIREGLRPRKDFPIIPGYDVCGEVIEKGPEAQGFSIGDDIIASPNLMRSGAHAEMVAVDSRTAAPKPVYLDHATAAALPLVGLTAYECLHTRACLKPGQSVLIHAGAGGVGHIAVQLAKLHGCHVITTAGREESIAFCRDELRADQVIDYTENPLPQVIEEQTDGRGIETIIDTVGGDVFDQSLDCLALNGTIVTILPVASTTISEKLFAKNATLHYEFMGIPTVHGIHPEAQGERLRILASLAEAGHLRPHVSTRIDLEDVPDGHMLQEQGHVLGKTVVTL